MSTGTPTRQSATLYSWNTKADDIKVKINGTHLEVSIGDTTLMLSAQGDETVYDLVKKFGEVEVVTITKNTVRV